MVRSMASDVSTLSGGVANGHQTVHLVSSTPSKIPYGGFSPVRLQTSLRRSHLRLPSRPAYRLPLFRVVGLRCLPRIQAGPRLLTRTAGPVALGSPTGSIVRPALRLLWPHLRLCRPPADLWIIPSGCEPLLASHRGSPIYSVSPSDHAVARTPVAPTTAFDDAFAAGSAFAP